MSLKEKIVSPFNDQIASEFMASAQYIAIAAYFDDLSLKELANFFYRQSDEERMHAMKFIHFMLESEVRPTIPAVPDLRNDFESAAEAVEFGVFAFVVEFFDDGDAAAVGAGMGHFFTSHDFPI